jgi:7,8-dihydropterin-6-yl-methyl-4-(beta-D-ribofuranosyl)aminobenzene 5'-phosphate synthase
MKITILTDNAAGPRFIATHGLSYYIEADINILFDTGPDNTFLENAKRLNLELNPDMVVLSHGHWDHGNGLEYSSGTKLVCHPQCFRNRFSKTKNIYVGLNKSKNELSRNFEIITSEKPYILSNQVTFLGEIPRLNDFEAKTTDFTDKSGNDDFIPDDSAIAIKIDNGLVIISGCAHAGICNTIDYAIEVTKISEVNAVFGGFHLKTAGSVTQITIEYFKKLGIEKAYPSHCTSLPALSEFYKTFKLSQVVTGNYYYF